MQRWVDRTIVTHAGGGEAAAGSRIADSTSWNGRGHLDSPPRLSLPPASPPRFDAVRQTADQNRMIFLAVAAACAAAAATPGDENRTVIKLGWLGFESTPVEADLATAFLSAVAAINLHPAVHLGDATMRVEPYLYQHGATTRITGYGSDPERLDTYRVLGRRQAFMLASGPGCLDSTYAHGETGIDVDAIVTDNAGEDAAQWLTIAEAFGKPVVSSIASSDALSDKVRAYFLGTLCG